MNVLVEKQKRGDIF